MAFSWKLFCSCFLTYINTVLKDEIEVSMKLAGLTSLDQAGPELLNTADVDHLIRSAQVFPALQGRQEKARL
jgi:L-lactate dehydrogenase (cytochrome)